MSDRPETPLLDSLPAFPQLEYIMALHEGVAVSAASFYAQASGRVTVANLHVAPGLGNGIGSLYGALKANSPVVVTAGQQDTRMRLKNPLLGHDLVAMAAPVTKWSVQIERADEILILEQGRILEHGERVQLAGDADSRFARLLRAGMEEVLA